MSVEMVGKGELRRMVLDMALAVCIIRSHVDRYNARTETFHSLTIVIVCFHT